MPRRTTSELAREDHGRAASLRACAHHLHDARTAKFALAVQSRGLLGTTDEGRGTDAETLLAHPKFLGAKPGIISALHNWRRKLSVHPHVHCLVTAGGLESDGRFVHPRRKNFLPGPVLNPVFRGTLCAFLKTAIASGNLVVPPSMTAAKCQSLLNRLGRARWNVRVQER